MNNVDMAMRLCNAICNTFYPDRSTVEVVLVNNGINPSQPATVKDAGILKAAIRLVMGYVEGSHSEGGVSVSVGRDGIKDNILFWCRDYGIDPDEVIETPLKVIEDGTHLW